MDEFSVVSTIEKGQHIIYQLLIMSEADRINIIDHEIYMKMIKDLLKKEFDAIYLKEQNDA